MLPFSSTYNEQLTLEQILLITRMALLAQKHPFSPDFLSYVPNPEALLPQPSVPISIPPSVGLRQKIAHERNRYFIHATKHTWKQSKYDDEEFLLDDLINNKKEE